MKGKDFLKQRKKMKLSQLECAVALGIDQGTVSRYETGKRPVPKVVELALEQIKSADYGK